LPIFSYITLATALTQLANRLYDPTEQFWSHLEKTKYLQEALRTWNALTSYWRGDFTFSSQQGVWFYDLTNTTTCPNTLRALTLHDTDLYINILNHLLEPSSGANPVSPYTGSTQFTADDIVQAVNRCRDELLSITGCTVTRHLIPAIAGRIQLPDTTIDLRRVSYLPNAPAAPSVLFLDDNWSVQAYNRGYTTKPAGTPFAYMLSTQPPLAFDVDIQPAFSGNYDCLTIDAGPQLLAATPSTLSIPDDWTHAIKWGALADLLSRESNPSDPLRAAYCAQQYRMAANLLTSASALLTLRIANIPLQIDALKSADVYRTGWQAAAQSAPTTAYLSGLNLLALAPAPDAGPYSLLATVVENAPVPSADTDLVQVSRDDLDAILDYSVHLAMFKCGGAEFQSTLPLMDRFVKQASLYNSRLSEWGEFSKLLLTVSQQEEEQNPRMEPAPSQ
jgi:hypothetical protein